MSTLIKKFFTNKQAMDWLFVAALIVPPIAHYGTSRTFNVNTALFQLFIVVIPFTTKHRQLFFSLEKVNRLAFWVFVGLISWFSITLFFAEHTRYAFNRSLAVSMQFVYGYCLWLYLLKKPAARKLIAYAISLSFLAPAVAIFVDSLWFGHQHNHYFNDPPFYSNIRHLGFHAACASVFALYIFTDSENRPFWKQIVSGAWLITCLAFVVWSGSRGSVVALIIAGLTITIFSHRSNHRVLIATLLSICIVPLLLYLFSVENFALSMINKTLTAKNADALLSQRITVWKDSLAAIDNFVLGIGADNFIAIEKRVSGITQAHNVIIQNLLDWGALGVLLFGILGCQLVIKILVFLRHPSLRDNGATAALALIIAALSLSLIGGVFYHALPSMLFATSCAILFSTPAFTNACTSIRHPINSLSNRSLSSSFRLSITTPLQRLKFQFNNSYWMKPMLLGISLLLMWIIFSKLARLGLPSAKGAGHKDDQTVALIMLALSWLSFLCKPRYGRIIFVTIITASVAFTLANWWFFEFYRDYISPGNLKLAIYAKESSMAWAGLSNKLSAFWFSFSMFALAVLIIRIDHWRPRPKSILIVSTICVALAIQQQIEYSGRATGGLAHRGESHISYFIRQLTSQDLEKVSASHIDSLARIYEHKAINKTSREYPLYDNRQDSSTRLKPNQKNVLILVVESFRAAESGAYGHKPSATPQFDTIATSSLVAKNAYANSNQTPRGELAILCSAMDYLNGAPFTVGGIPIKTNCLPSMLASIGYTTHWIHGYTKEFFNRGQFYPYLGFQQLHDYDTIKLSSDKLDSEIGWGIADIDVFDYALKELEKSTKPFFAEVLTLSNHYPYLWDWGIEYPEEFELPKDFDEESKLVYPAYVRGIYYSDYALGKFWKKFVKSSLYDNTLVVIVADHGIWSFSKDLKEATGIDAEFKRSETYFRIPLVIHAPDLDATIIEQPVSQLDIAPTILDYLDLEFQNAFLGQSIFTLSKNNSDNPIFFITGGSYGFRQGDLRCYPVDKSQTCANAYRKCGSKQQNSARQLCVRSRDDLLITQTQELQPIDYELNDSKNFIELSQYWLKHGFMPTESLHNKQLFKNRLTP